MHKSKHFFKTVSKKWPDCKFKAKKYIFAKFVWKLFWASKHHLGYPKHVWSPCTYFFRMKLIVMGANGLSGYAKAWPPGVGRTWSWPCLASSSWSAKRFAEPLYLSGTRRTSCLSGTKLPMILGWLIVFETPSDEFSTYLPELPLSIKLIMTP